MSVPGRQLEQNHSRCRWLSAATALEGEEGGEEVNEERGRWRDRQSRENSELKQ